MEFHKLERDFIPPAKSDYILDKMKDFEKLFPYLYPKIEGMWKVVLVDFAIKDCRVIINEFTIPDYISLEIYLRPDTLGHLWNEFPKYRIVQKSKWDTYLELIANYPRLISRRASSEIFKRSDGNTDTIREALAALLTITADDEEITVKHVNSVLLASDSVYARDVILTMLLKPKSSIPPRGHTLSRFKYNNAFELYDKLEHYMGKRAAFFSLRKYLKKLYEMKLDYLKNKEVKEEALMSHLDIYEIAHAYYTFLLSSPMQVFACLYLIEERTKHVSSFESTVLAQHY